MSNQPICPHCGHDLGEDIPKALVGSIQLNCPLCSLTYSFQRDVSEHSGAEEEYYLSTGLFRKKPLHTQDGSFQADEIRIWFILSLCCIIPLILMSIIIVIIALTSTPG